VSGNTATASNTAGDATAFGGGVVVDGVLVLSGSTIGNNRVRVKVPGGTASAMFAGLGVENGAFATTTKHSDSSHNRVAASTTSGSVTLRGAGIGHLNGAPLVLRETTVTRNVATGKWTRRNRSGRWHLEREPGPLQFPRAASPDRQHRGADVLKASAGVAARGGEIFTIAKPSIRHTTIAHNRPDQCHRC
jgi:hypothetical protein